MKHSAKAYLLTSSCCAALFACSFVYAASKAHISHEMQQTTDKKQKNTSSLLFRTSAIRYQGYNPLLVTKPSQEEITYNQCNAKKKNELYELSAIFNDKLQLFLAYFDDRPIYNVASKSNRQKTLANRDNVSYIQ
ncbi:hypothetical protein tinsulaeT_27050 [Thalassotalea insulae]|uniref:Uncharacterized protein n=1 Tax=Thalassotalea insulae TaxID=2056778 RepID=A0ABQ6GTU4_9GAMM|nr:hypothetical protein [Thalassotalea insulae]GLX79365.1 hypothetical protein tinsulaeT_27050 [Thalassotalea insulae]